MVSKKIRIIGISGSLRAGSSANAVLQTVSRLVPEQVDFNIYTGIAGIEAFNDARNCLFL